MLAYSVFRIGKFLDEYKFFIILGLLLVLAFFIVPNISAIAEKFGFETRADLKSQVTAAKIVNQQVVAANVNLTKELANEKKASETTLNIVTEKLKTDIKVATTVTNIKAKRDQVIAKVTTNKVPPNSTTATGTSTVTMQIDHPYTQADIQEISSANIAAIWDAYNSIEGTQNG